MKKWYVAPEGERLRVWCDTPVKHGVADICPCRNIDEKGPGVIENNRANVIAAAPDLLAALERCVSLMKRGDIPAIAERAIAKAKG